MPLALKTYPDDCRGGFGAQAAKARAISAAARWSCAPPTKATCRCRPSCAPPTRRSPRSRSTAVAPRSALPSPCRPLPAIPGSRQSPRPRRRSAGRRSATWRRSAAIFSRRRPTATSPWRCWRSTRPCTPPPARWPSTTFSPTATARSSRRSASLFLTPGKFRFLKVSRIKPKGVSVLSIAALIDADAGKVTSARIALGCMADRPIRAKAAEKALVGATLDAAGHCSGGGRGRGGHRADHRRHRERLVSRRSAAGAFPSAAARSSRRIGGRQSLRPTAGAIGRKNGEGSSSVHAQRRGKGRVRRQRRDAARRCSATSSATLAQGRLRPGHLRRLLGA